MDERIDAFLADVEAAEFAAERHARRGEYGDELAAQAAERTLLERLRGSLGAVVRVTLPQREIAGTLRFLGRDIIVVVGIETSVAAMSGIQMVKVESRAHHFEPGGLERLGMASALRRWQAMRAEISVDVRDRPGPVRGCCSFVGADYVEIAGRIIPFAAVTAAHGQFNPFE